MRTTTKASAFRFAAALILPLILPVSANHWMLGDETAVHCYASDPANPDTPNQPSLEIKGLTMKWTKPIDASSQLKAGVPIDSSITVSLAPEFYTDNSNIDLGDIPVNGTGFRDLCLGKRVTASGSAACASNMSPTDDNCCIWHANIHACRQQEAACAPWVMPENSTSDASYVLVTHTSAMTGFIDSPIQFDGLVLAPDAWTMIAHVKILKFQCAIGVLRTISATDDSSVTAVAPQAATGWASWQIALVSSAAFLALVAIAGCGFLLYRQNKKCDGDPKADNDADVSSQDGCGRSSNRQSQAYSVQHPDNRSSNNNYEPMQYVAGQEYRTSQAAPTVYYSEPTQHEMYSYVSSPSYTTAPIAMTPMAPYLHSPPLQMMNVANYVDEHGNVQQYVLDQSHHPPTHIPAYSQPPHHSSAHSSVSQPQYVQQFDSQQTLFSSTPPSTDTMKH